MSHTARPHVLHEASYRQLQALQPNVAVLPWGATEAHNFHLPHGTDVIEAESVAAEATARANQQGATCLMLPTIPFGVNHTQLDQVATITMRASTQLAVLHDISESLVRQNIDRLVLLNFHGGNEFKPMMRDVMLDLPIFLVEVHGFRIAPKARDLLENATGDHADEFETSLVMHLQPDWVEPLSIAGDGTETSSSLPALCKAPGIWFARSWSDATSDTGIGNPRAATPEKGRRIFEMIVDTFVPVLTQLSAATPGQYPFVIPAQRA